MRLTFVKLDSSLIRVGFPDWNERIIGIPLIMEDCRVGIYTPDELDVNGLEPDLDVMFHDSGVIFHPIGGP